MHHRVQTASRALAALALLAAAPVALADKLVFDPSISLGAGYNNNIAFVQAPGDERQTDVVGVFQFEIPFERETRRSNLRVRYRPTILRYQDFDVLDYTDHRFDLYWRAETGRRGTFDLRSDYVNTQQQGSPEQPTDPDINLTRRVDRETFRLFAGYRRQLTQRWDGTIRVDGSAYRFNPIEGIGGNFQDRTDTGIRLAGSHQISTRSSVGGRYEYRYFDLDEGSDPTDPLPGGSESSNQVAATYRQDIARRLELRAALGVFFDSGLAEGLDRSGILAELFLTRTYKSFTVRLDLFHRPSVGGSLAGTAIESTLGLTFSSPRDGRRKWTWRISPRGTARDSSVVDSTVYTFGLRGDLSRSLGNLFGLRLWADWFDQNRDQSGANSNVFRADIGFLIYPWGATDLGGRAR